MDPRQPRRDSCKVCRSPLPARKSRYCARACRARWAIWQKRWRRGPSPYFEWLKQVVAPVPVPETEAAQAQARLLVRAGHVLAYERRERGRRTILAIGKPGRSEYVAAQARERRARVQAEKAAEAVALEAAELEAQRLRAAA